MRNYHTSQTISAIHNTAQVIIDVYRKKNDIFIQPLKVFKRYTNTIYMLHQWKGEKFIPVTSSSVISEILGKVQHTWANIAVSQQDMWNRVFVRAQEIKGDAGKSRYEEYKQRLMRMIIG